MKRMAELLDLSVDVSIFSIFYSVFFVRCVSVFLNMK